MEKLRIKLNPIEANILGTVILIYKTELKLKTLENISHHYILLDVLNRLAMLSFKGGRLSINPAEAVTLSKMNFNNNLAGDIYVQNIIDKFSSDIHKYLTKFL